MKALICRQMEGEKSVRLALMSVFLAEERNVLKAATTGEWPGG
nr:hypothetical protein [Escherichia coli]